MCEKLEISKRDKYRTHYVLQLRLRFCKRIRELNAVKSIGKHSRMNDDSRVGISEQAVTIKVNQFLFILNISLLIFSFKEYSVARSKKYMCNLPVRCFILNTAFECNGWM